MSPSRASSQTGHLPGRTTRRRKSSPFSQQVTRQVTARQKRPRLQLVTKAKVLIVHLIPFVSAGIAQMLSGNREFEVCDTTDDAPTARRLFERHRPRVTIIGPALRGGDGIQLMKDLRKMDSRAAILMLSAMEDPTFIRCALRAGALGYLRVLDGRAELLSALQHVITGNRYISQALAQAVYRGLATRDAGRSKIDILSDREREVFLLIGEDATLAGIAAQLGVSVNSVQTYFKRIKQKLGTRSNAQLREKAARAATKRAWKTIEQSALSAA